MYSREEVKYTFRVWLRQLQETAVDERTLNARTRAFMTLLQAEHTKRTLRKEAHDSRNHGTDHH